MLEIIRFLNRYKFRNILELTNIFFQVLVTDYSPKTFTIYNLYRLSARHIKKEKKKKTPGIFHLNNSEFEMWS
jgi:hypothetical protein